ncbi:MAG: DUF3050 domain-containing protein [bacterium]
MAIARHLLSRLTPYRDRLYAHSIYQQLNNEDNIIKFMGYHVYSVWDFMNLLTHLQQQLTCTTIPWKPVPDVKAAQLLNEIKCEEESDEIDGTVSSHFMYYVGIIQTATHCPWHVPAFLKDLTNGVPYDRLIKQAYLPESVQQYLAHTQTMIQSSVLQTAASFTYARETIMSDMLAQISQHDRQQSPVLSSFYEYLNRHIELDGERHQFLALDIIDQLCQSKTDEECVYKAAVAGIEARLTFWDAIEHELNKE